MVDHDVYQSPDVGFSTMHGIFTMLSSLRVGVSSVRVGMVGSVFYRFQAGGCLIRARRDDGYGFHYNSSLDVSHPCA